MKDIEQEVIREIQWRAIALTHVEYPKGSVVVWELTTFSCRAPFVFDGHCKRYRAAQGQTTWN